MIILTYGPADRHRCEIQVMKSLSTPIIYHPESKNIETPPYTQRSKERVAISYRIITYHVLLTIQGQQYLQISNAQLNIKTVFPGIRIPIMKKRWSSDRLTFLMRIYKLGFASSRLCLTFMITSSNGNGFRVTGLLCGEFTVHRGIPLTKASDTELWCFLWSAPWLNGCVNNHKAGDRDAIVLIMTSL